MTSSATPPEGCTLGELERWLGDAGVRLVGGPGASTLRVVDVTQDSRQVESGTLFVARRGESVDGGRFAEDARHRGAVAVLCEPGDVELEPRLEVTDLARGWALAAHAVHGLPSQKLPVIGITGTNGKTTTACLLEQALQALGARPARLGTLGFFLGGKKLADTLTTPQPDDLARHLAAAHRGGATHVVMEVSSHALEQERAYGVRFAVAAFTNLSLDHLDYHGTLEQYAAVKRRLLDAAAPAKRVIHVDDAWGQRWATELGLSASGQDLRVSSSGAFPAEVVAERFAQSASGLVASVRVGETRVELRSRLVGAHNLENLLVALACLVALGFSAEEAAPALSGAVGAPGRLERCDTDGDDVQVFVDYAHTPDALRRCLEAVGVLGAPRVTCVFGCGGDRDRSKRPLMGEVAVRNAGRVLVTSDNPRREPPLQIIDEIRPGLSGAGGGVEVLIEPDRARAIERAVLEASPGEIVLVAGKGHETYQILGDRIVDFDDRVEARRALALRRANRVAGRREAMP